MTAARFLILAAVTVACSGSPGSAGSPASAGRAATARLDVRYRDGRGVDHRTTIDVPLRTRVAAAAARWHETLSQNGCEGQETRTLTLRDRSGATVQVGPPCGWTDEPGPVSPDGRYLVAWVPWDGCGSDMHLVELGATPADLGKVPDSRSADYIATWSDDGRVWFTSDESSGAPDGRLYSFGPGDTDSSFVEVRGPALIRSVRPLRDV